MANLYNNYNTGNSLAIQSNQQLVPNSSMNGMQFGSWNNSYTLNTRPTLNNQNTGIIWVNGIEGAKGYIIQPNSAVVLMDSEKNYFYLKTANDAGIASIRVFEFEEKQNNINTVVNTADLQNYVSKEEFEELKQVLNNINNTLLANISKQEEPVVNSSSTSKYKEKKEV